jgi:uncharacterized membrane protein YesL
MAAMAGFRTVWAALVALYEDTLVLVGGNLAAVALNLPLGLALLLLGLPFLSATDSAADTVAQVSLQWPIAAIAWFITFLPTPGNVALAGLTRAAAGHDVPRFGAFVETLRGRWGIASRCALISVVVLVALLWNVSFYLNLGPGWPLLVTIIWLYATSFWLGMHIYLVPLLVHVAEPRVLDLYRRAAFVSLGHAGYTFVLLVLLLLITFAAVVFLPLYVLLAQSFVSLAQANALREIRRRHGDLAEAEADEEASRL